MFRDLTATAQRLVNTVCVWIDQYLVSARKEQEAVGVLERISGLPTLLILKPDGDIIDRDGVKEDGIHALEKWLHV